jgi:hypothetical protein
MTCPRCGKFEDADAAYCSACGSALTPTAPRQPGAARLTPTGPQRSASGMGGFLVGIGVILIIVNIVLQFIRLSFDGLSESASAVNGICQSAIGQLGRAITSRIGYAGPQDLCGKAAAIEDWKGVTLWLGIVLIAAGLVLIARRAGWVAAWSAGPRTGQ